MQIGVISDIHGNYLALTAVLRDLEALRPAPDRVVCLGDAIQGGPQPAEVTRALRERGWPVVMGNADDWLITGQASDAEQVSAERQAKLDAVRTWSLAQLSEADKTYIASFTPTVEVPLEAGRKLLAFHGSPASFDDILLPTTPEADFQRLLGAHAGHLLCGGHTHLQQIRRLGDGFFFNPGSVGLAYSHAQSDEGFRADPWAEYALLSADGGRLRLEFRRVPFDAAELRRVYRASGRPFAEEAAAQYGE
jgi:predicted phosphodiesterase